MANGATRRGKVIAALTEADIRLARAMYQQGYRPKFILRKMPSQMTYTYLRAILYHKIKYWEHVT